MRVVADTAVAPAAPAGSDDRDGAATGSGDVFALLLAAFAPAPAPVPVVVDPEAGTSAGPVDATAVEVGLPADTSTDAFDASPVTPGSPRETGTEPTGALGDGLPPRVADTPAGPDPAAAAGLPGPEVELATEAAPGGATGPEAAGTTPAPGAPADPESAPLTDRERTPSTAAAAPSAPNPSASTAAGERPAAAAEPTTEPTTDATASTLLVDGDAPPLERPARPAPTVAPAPAREPAVALDAIPVPTFTLDEAAAAAATAPTHPTEQVARVLRATELGPTGEQRIEIELTPEDLGTVTVELVLDGDALHVTLVADGADAADALRHDLDRLRAEFGTVDLRQLDVRDGRSDGRPDPTTDDRRPPATPPAAAEVAPGPTPPSPRPADASTSLDLLI